MKNVSFAYESKNNTCVFIVVVFVSTEDTLFPFLWIEKHNKPVESIFTRTLLHRKVGKWYRMLFYPSAYKNIIIIRVKRSNNL